MLSDALERECEAWRLLHDPETAGRLSLEQTYKLCLRAGYGERAAREAAKEGDRERWKRGGLPW